MPHEATLFVMQMAGDSMINAGIHNGDLLIVDRSLTPVPGDVVAAVMDDEIAIKRLVSRASITILHAENPRYPDYMPSNGASPAIWGIVTDVIHPLISSSDRRTTASANTSTPATLVPAC
jgi:SOS-response transcriptional repressor LexA